MRKNNINERQLFHTFNKVSALHKNTHDEYMSDIWLEWQYIVSTMHVNVIQCILLAYNFHSITETSTDITTFIPTSKPVHLDWVEEGMYDCDLQMRFSSSLQCILDCYSRVAAHYTDYRSHVQSLLFPISLQEFSSPSASWRWHRPHISQHLGKSMSSKSNNWIIWHLKQLPIDIDT